MDKKKLGRYAAHGTTGLGAGAAGALVGSLLDFTFTGGVAGLVTGLGVSIVSESRGLAKRRTEELLKEQMPLPGEAIVTDDGFLDGYLQTYKDVWNGVKENAVILKFQEVSQELADKVCGILEAARERLKEAGATKEVADAYYTTVALVGQDRITMVK